MLELLLRLYMPFHDSWGFSAGRCMDVPGAFPCIWGDEYPFCDSSAITRSESRGLKALTHGASHRVGVVEVVRQAPWLSGCLRSEGLGQLSKYEWSSSGQALRHSGQGLRSSTLNFAAWLQTAVALRMCFPHWQRM